MTRPKAAIANPADRLFLDEGRARLFDPPIHGAAGI